MEIFIPQNKIFSDASNRKWGIVFNKEKAQDQIQVCWTSDESLLHINDKEMLVILKALKAFSIQFHQSHILVCSDNRMATIATSIPHLEAKALDAFTMNWALFKFLLCVPSSSSNIKSSLQVVQRKDEQFIVASRSNVSQGRLLRNICSEKGISRPDQLWILVHGRPLSKVMIRPHFRTIILSSDPSASFSWTKFHSVHGIFASSLNYRGIKIEDILKHMNWKSTSTRMATSLFFLQKP